MAEIREQISLKEICELGVPHSSFNCGRVRNRAASNILLTSKYQTMIEKLVVFCYKKHTCTLQRRGISCYPPSTRRKSPTSGCPAWWGTGTTTAPRRAAAGPSSGTPPSASTSAPSPTPATFGASGSYSGRCTGRTQCCGSFSVLCGVDLFLSLMLWILFCPLCCGSFSALYVVDPFRPFVDPKSWILRMTRK
jgi:hypothetical protein